MTTEQKEIISGFCERTDFFTSSVPRIRTLWLTLKLISRKGTCYDALYTNGQGKSVALVGSLIRHQRWIHHHHTSGNEADALIWPRSYVDAMRRVDRLIACSTSNADVMGAILGRRVDSVRYLTNQIRIERHSYEGRPLRFGFFGRLIREKGIDMIARLSEDDACQDIEWHMWGEGDQYPPSFFEKHPKLIKHDAFRDVHGLRNALSLLDAHVLLSTNNEGLPLALLECMGAGVPWISSDRGGVRDVLCDPLGTIMIPANFDYETAKEAVLRLARNLRSGKFRPDLMIDYYNSHLSSEVICSKWLELFSA
jgi:glycosyltransferase involved in cell wall biosynthesis